MILEWRKAITILIVSFVVLNLFMFINLWFKEKPIAEFALTLNQQSEIEELLRQKGVTLKAEIPKDGRAQSLLEIEFQKIEEKKILEGFFGNEVKPKFAETKDGRNYTLGNRQLIITDNGFITYINNQDQIIWPNLTKEQAEKEAIIFMNSHGVMPEQAYLIK